MRDTESMEVEMNINIEDANIFMMCSTLNKLALTKLPLDFHIRSIRKAEIELWKSIF